MEIEVKIEELRKKKIFVATPMYGGMCTGMYTKSSCDLATISQSIWNGCEVFLFVQ